MILGPKISHDLSKDFIETVMSGLDTVFATPEESIIWQGTESDAMYFISQGECTIDITDENRIVQKTVRLLVEGDHFGEIGLIYGCVRSATVISRNYNTMAKLNKERFRALMG